MAVNPLSSPMSLIYIVNPFTRVPKESPIYSLGMTTYTPSNGFSGSDSFTFKATDNHGAESNIATFTLTILGD